MSISKNVGALSSYLNRILTGKIANRIRERNLHLEFTDKAIELLAEKGYNINYGARPLRRVLQNMIETPLAKEIIKGLQEDGKIVF
jgi:ATP-dependent Clp protease ATP-binding subunit ClpA